MLELFLLRCACYSPKQFCTYTTKNEVKRVIIGGCISSFLTWCLNETAGRFANEPITVN